MSYRDGAETLFALGAYVSPLLLALTVLAVALFVWPTLYRYDRTAIPGWGQTLVRTNRFTGKSAYLSAAGWMTAEPEPTPIPGLVVTGTGSGEPSFMDIVRGTPTPVPNPGIVTPRPP